MVCLGNICRSPLAEGILKDKAAKAGLDWEIESAGTNHYQTGCAPHSLSQKVAKIYGIEIGHLKCRQFTWQDMVNFDKIYVMDEYNYQDVKRLSKNGWQPQKVDLLLNELYPGENRTVPDPYMDGEFEYHNVYKLVERACARIVEKYGRPILKV